MSRKYGGAFDASRHLRSVGMLLGGGSKKNSEHQKVIPRGSRNADSAIALSLVLWNVVEKKHSPDWMKKYWERHQQKLNGID